MKSEHDRAYNREWMKHYRIRNREAREALAANAANAAPPTEKSARCPTCSIILKPEFESSHKGCPWYEAQEASHLHARDDEWREDFVI